MRPGFGSVLLTLGGAGVACDYPVEATVLWGTVYAFGTMTGALGSPPIPGAGSAVNGLLEAVRTALLNSPLLGGHLKGIYDTMGEEERPPVGQHQYPYGAFWLADFPDASDWAAGGSNYFEFGVGVFDNRADGAQLGLFADEVIAVLNGVTLTDLTGRYEDFIPELQPGAERVKQSPEVWVFVLTFRALVSLRP